MALTKRRLKGLIEYSDLRNVDGVFTEDEVMGVSTDKCMFPTKADLGGVNLLNYKLFSPGSFAFVADTSRRGDKIALAYNNTDKTYIVSTWYVVFKVCDNARDIISPDYLFLYFNRAEFDRYARTNSWGSAREYFWFSDMEEIIIELPPLPVQQKYVAIYKAMVANQQSYERGLEDLKLVCDGYIEDLRRKMPCEAIGIMSNIALLNASCADQQVDAVVNAANSGLRAGGGICGVIFKKAGMSALTAACPQYKTPLKDGSAVITPAFRMTNAKYIIHAVCPDFGRTPKATFSGATAAPMPR